LLTGPNVPTAQFMASMPRWSPVSITKDHPAIPMHGGFLYLVAVMDWFSRFVLSWELSNTLETSFCLAALEAAFASANPKSGIPIRARNSLARFPGTAKTAGRVDQHGWARPRPRQRVHRSLGNRGGCRPNHLDQPPLPEYADGRLYSGLREPCLRR